MTTPLPEEFEASLRRLDWRDLAERLAGEDMPPAWEDGHGLPRDGCPCCGEGARTEPPLPTELRSDRRRVLETSLERCPEAVRVELTREVTILPGDVLADRTGERFHAAAGLTPEQLATLGSRAPTLGDLCRRHGRPWVEFHVLRLWCLGLVRLRGPLPA